MVTPRIKALGHDVAISCFFGLEGGTIEWDGIPCFPTDQSRFGLLMLGEYADRHGGGDRGQVLVFTLQDVWVLLQGMQNMEGCRFASWCPVDHDPAPPLVVEWLKKSESRVVAMSQFGRDRLEQAGVEVVATIPHLVDCEVFKPDRSHIADYRAALKLPADAFVVGMVANNQGNIPPRKSFPQVFDAFSKFQRRHSDAILYLHSDVFGRNNGVNLIELGNQCGIPSSALATSDQLSLHLGIPPELVAGVYNAMDVLAMPSMGEGFGIPLVEAQACGVPVITTDWTAMTELCGAGWLVDGERFYDATQHSWFKNPSTGDILDAMELAYVQADSLRGQAREFALRFNADTVFDQEWVPVLEQLAMPREVGPLQLAA